MEINPLMLEMIKHNNNMITTAQATELGFSRSLLSYYTKKGLLEREFRGVYILSECIRDERDAKMNTAIGFTK